MKVYSSSTEGEDISTDYDSRVGHESDSSSNRDMNNNMNKMIDNKDTNNIVLTNKSNNSNLIEDKIHKEKIVQEQSGQFQNQKDSDTSQII